MSMQSDSPGRDPAPSANLGLPLPSQTSGLLVRPHWTQPSTPFRHTWQDVINVDQFRWFVRRDLQEQLTVARAELGAKHVRAVGMFDDELRVFRPSPESFMGQTPKDPRTNWQIVDYAIDSLLDRGLNPMFTTSFVPSAMASGPVTVFTTKGHTSPPKDWKQWDRFIREAVTHAIERYSPEVVRQWYFEAWNEPNLNGWFWGGDQADFFRFWQVTYEAIKGVDPALRVGGPSTAKAEWLEELLAFGQQHGCAPDYLISHIYNNDSTVGAPLAPFDGPQEDRMGHSPNFAIGAMRGVRALADRLGFKGELHWNEWGRSFHAIDPRREDSNEAAFIVRLLGQVSQEADVFAYWCLSDIYDQVGYGREAFHGGYGLLNLQGLRKPAYHAFHLLTQLGTQRVSLDSPPANDLQGAIVTRGPAADHVLAYAYQHVDHPSREPIEVTVELPPDAGTVTLHRVDSRENNVITQWRELGAPAYLSRAQTRDLAASNALQRAARGTVKIASADGRAIARFTMENSSIALLEIARPR